MLLGNYDRNYMQLTEEEINQWNQLKQREIVSKLGGMEERKSLFREYPNAARHYLSLFPNHYLDIVDLKNEQELNDLADKYLEMLDSPGTPERLTQAGEKINLKNIEHKQVMECIITTT